MMRAADDGQRKKKNKTRKRKQGLKGVPPPDGSKKKINEVFQNKEKEKGKREKKDRKEKRKKEKEKQKKTEKKGVPKTTEMDHLRMHTFARECGEPPTNVWFSWERSAFSDVIVPQRVREVAL